MAVAAVMISQGPKRAVACATCEAPLMRRLLRPYDGQPILRFFCNHKCKAVWQRTQKSVDEAWLRQKYEVERLDCTQIAKIVGRNSKQVWQWLRGYGIQTRPRGDASRLYQNGRPPGFRMGDEQKAFLRECRKRDGHYPKQADGRPYWTGKARDQHPAWRGGLTPERQAFYASLEWRRACRVVWMRADAKCERCGEDHRIIDRTERRFHIHHIVSFMVRELRAEPSNLVLLCDRCHRFVHSSGNTDRQFLGKVEK